jgi:hypothetical protein
LFSSSQQTLALTGQLEALRLLGHLIVYTCMKNQMICSLYNWIQRKKMLDSDDLRKGM